MGCIEGKSGPAWEERERAYFAFENDDDRVRCRECRLHDRQGCRKNHGSHPDILRRCFAYTPKKATAA